MNTISCPSPPPETQAAEEEEEEEIGQESENEEEVFAFVGAVTGLGIQNAHKRDSRIPLLEETHRYLGDGESCELTEEEEEEEEWGQENDENEEKEESGQEEENEEEVLALAAAVAGLSIQNAHERDCRIQLLEETHTYIVDGELCEPAYVSVTIFIKDFFTPFDPDFVIDRMMQSRRWRTSEYFGMTRKEIKDVWDKARTDGNAVHKAAEHVLNGKGHLNIESGAANVHARELELLDGFMQERLSEGWEVYRSEWRIFDEEVRIAGTVDAVFRLPPLPGANGSDGEGGRVRVAVYDWKRSKNIRRENLWQYGKAPLGHLGDCNFNHYALQLYWYKRILEEKYALAVEELGIINLYPDDASPQERFIISGLPVMEEEVDWMYASRMAQLEQAK